MRQRTGINSALTYEISVMCLKISGFQKMPVEIEATRHGNG